MRNSSGVRTAALLGKQNLTLEECILHCRSQEQSRARTTIMGQSVKQEPTDSGLQASASIFSTKGVLPQRNALASCRSASLRCQYCGHTHQRGCKHCPAFGQRCSKCGGRNHFASVCRSRGTRQSLIRAVDIDEDGGPTTCVVGEDFDVLALTLMRIMNILQKRWMQLDENIKEDQSIRS